MLFHSHFFFFFFIFSLLSSVFGSYSTPLIGCVTFAGPPTPLCSGQGECVLIEGLNQTIIDKPLVSGSQCLCKEGWTGRGDFIDLYSHDCSQSIVGIRIIWIIVCISTLLEFVLIGKKLKISYQRLLETINPHLHFEQPRNIGEEQGLVAAEDILPTPISSVNTPTTSTPGLRTRTISNNITKPTWHDYKNIWHWPVVCCSVVAGISAIFMFFLSLVRMVCPECSIGSYPLTTFLYAMSDVLFWTAERTVAFSWLQVRSKLLRFTAENELKAKAAIRDLTYTLYSGFIFDGERVILLLLLHVLPEKQQLLTTAIYLSASVSLIVSIIGLLRSGKALEKILLDGIDNLKGTAQEERKKALAKVRQVIRYQQLVMVPFVPGCALFGLWPWLRAKSTYIMANLAAYAVIQAGHLIGLSPPTIAHLRKEQGLSPRNPHGEGGGGSKGGSGGKHFFAHGGSTVESMHHEGGGSRTKEGMGEYGSGVGGGGEEIKNKELELQVVPESPHKADPNASLDNSMAPLRGPNILSLHSSQDEDLSPQTPIAESSPEIENDKTGEFRNIFNPFQ